MNISRAMNFFFGCFFALLLTSAAYADPAADLKDVEKAYELANNGQRDDALKLLDDVITRNSSFAPAYFHRGMLLMQTDELDRALSNFNKALQIDAELTQAYLGRAMVYFMKQDLDSTIKDLDQAIERDPELAVAYYNRGIAYSYKEDFMRAFDDLSAARKYGYPVEDELIEQVWGLGHTENVVAEATANILKNPEDGPSYYNRAVAQYYQKQYPQALEDLQRAQKLGVEVEEGFVEELETLIAQPGTV